MGTRRPHRSHHRAEADPLAARFGARVRALRDEAGYSFDAFAEELGRGYVSELERGLLIPTLRTLARLTELFEVELIDLLAFGDTPRELLVLATRELSAAQVRRLLREARTMATGGGAVAASTAVNPSPEHGAEARGRVTKVTKKRATSRSASRG